ncbi:hypothetical protein AJ80_04384 [Polytolypa hystricis UAMH7299]|uniref:NDT80 domain-containing protein n=1 Tax=Polytolypa hystricis (strain UAMH7299) TaxID=1447883 RepID=A0A2B7YBZ9_POLH7|nr:hypothetical protein AJ80_04384 [Polytolypa hystricis UAMH7299]
MEGFDTMTMSYLASPLSINNMQSADYLNAMPPMEMPDPQGPYDHETFVSGDDIGFAQPPMPTNAMRRFSSSQFEEPFAGEIMPMFEVMQPDQSQTDASIDHNHKLLNFSLPMYNFTLLDFSLRRTSLSMSAQLHGMFFLAESNWTTSPTAENSGPPPMTELTCYRRNLFQITGSITLPRTLRYIMTDQGDRIPILAQELTVSATESVEGNPVKIISVPWKTPAANANGPPEDKTEKEPPSIPLDTMGGQDVDSEFATFSIAWKRLQFRIATANNGRRKELQQHFIVRLKVVATLSTGTKISICEAQSHPVIVRGRSPRNFQSRKDLPLSGSAAASRKHAQAAALNRTAASNNSPGSQQGTSAKRSKSPPEPTSVVSQQQQWTQAPSHTSAAVPTPGFTATVATANGGIPSCSQSSPEVPRQKRRRTSISGTAISLSLADDETSPLESAPHPNPSGGIMPMLQITNDLYNGRHEEPEIPPHSKSHKKSPTISGARQPLSHTRSASNNIIFTQLQYTHPPPLASPYILNPTESADLLYEYFPLGLDDWQAPVDAVYRPHVVHHTNLPDDPKALAARSRSKRYFAGES